MDSEVPHKFVVEGVTPPESPTEFQSTPLKLSPAPIAIVPALALAACGGGSSGSTTASAPPAVPAPAPPPPPPPPPPPTGTQSGRFLAQASMGSSAADIASVTSKGYDGWLSEQFNKPRPTSFWNWLVNNGRLAIVNMFRQDGFDSMVWSQLIGAEDQLRQRVGSALLSIFVVGIEATPTRWQQFSMAAYMDILWDNAFGNYRTLLDQIALSPVMGYYLTYINSKKSNAQGAVPDENFAREIMQLFSIGLYELNLDGTQKIANGKPIETYTLADVTGLARVFTGWYVEGNADTAPDLLKGQMVQRASDHELGAKTFLGKTIPAGTDGVASLKIALDHIFAHANVAPFISKQLIQRLVTSNPSPAYVQRVATIFDNNGSGIRGDLRAVVRAILLDADARNDAAALSSTTFGKLREPVMRLTSWARAFGATSPSGEWAIGDTSGSVNLLAQGIGRSPSVFNFFRPGYTPPNTMIATQAMVAPEYQITNEQTVVGYINFMALMLINGAGDFKPDNSEYLAKAADSQALLDMINLRLAANQVSAATIAQIKTAVDSLPSATPADLTNRINIAVLAIMASPEFLIQK
jgi:uncharacterized protein (DUF1800 family)